MDMFERRRELPEGVKVDERLRRTILERVAARKGYWPAKKNRKRKPHA